jgi:hypothetical protein
VAAGEASGDETPEAGGAGAGDQKPETQEPPAPAALTAEQNILDMDIRTSTLMELAAWCRSLGLPESGSQFDLARRLREHYQITSPPTGTVENQKIITIESARTTEYFTLDIVDEEYARLTGDVIVSLKDGEAIHQVKAWQILYNRTRNVITASGGVEYVKREGDTVETFRGENITVNLDNWSSIFMDGLSERSLSGADTTYRFAGTIISRSEEGVTALTKARVSNAKNEEAYWSLHASRLWLMPGSDWAVANAVLKVGEIPVLYLPFFFYPSDEIVFHPVIGYRSREGNFLQTTTYILGRPKANESSESSITKILGSSAGMEKTREGIFLRSTGRKSQDPNDTRLSLLFDAYANLGLYLGTELAFPRKGIFDNLNLSLGLGLTRDVYVVGGNHTPFVNPDGSSEWNSSYIFSFNIPLRYRMKGSGSVTFKYLSLSLDFPFYSDRYVERDFMKRREDMDWIGMLKGDTEDQQNTTENILSSYEWRLGASVYPSVSKFSPYLSSLSISGISSTISFQTRTSSRGSSVSPSRDFFYPNKFTLYSISGSLSGTPLSLGEVKSTAPPSQQEKPEAKENLFENIGVPRSPWPVFEAENLEDTENSMKLSPPALAQRFELPAAGGLRFSVDYRLNPTAATEMQFRSSLQNWPNPEDINWSEISSILTTARSDGSLGFNFSEREGFFSGALRVSGTGAWQDYNYLNEEAEEFPSQAKIDEARQRTYNATYLTTSYEVTNSFKPMLRSPVWGNSSLQYSLKGLLGKTVFTGTGGLPDWNWQMGEWIKENLDIHQFSVNLSANVMDYIQTFSVTTELPPREPVIAASTTLRTWIFETTARTRVVNPYEDSRTFEPVHLTETIKLGSQGALGSLSGYMIYDPKLSEITTLTSSLSMSGFTASLSAVRAKGYDFIPGLGWNLSTEPESLDWSNMRMAYSKTFKKEKLWKERLTFQIRLDTGLTFDLQRYTDSRFNFSLGFILNIVNFIDLTLSSASENAVIYRYFKDFFFFDDKGITLPEGDQNNIFMDLLNSFRFDDDDRRKSSGFKLKSLNLGFTHHLGDWDATLAMTLSPYRDDTGGIPVYKFNNEITFLVKWLPINEIKTEIYHNKDKYTFR